MPESRPEIIRAWAAQLIVEYQQICWLYKVELRPPVFEIIEGQSQAGAWSSEFASLKIGSWLIMDHDWHVVVEVLRHEMAHQYVDQVMAKATEVAHGPAFQEACDRLGVHPDFRSATGVIPRLVKGEDASDNPILNKVEKLFSLARSANEHEAALAMQKANLLLRKHNIARIEGNVATSYDYVVINEKKKRLAAHQRFIASILKDFFYVNVVVAKQFDAKSLDSYRVIELIGAKENLKVAEYVYHFLDNRLAFLWQGYRKKYRVPGREKKSYYLGILSGFRDKLENQDQSLASDDCATSDLVCANDLGLIRYYRSRYPRLRSIRLGAAKVYGDTYDAGQQEGHQLVIHKGVGASDGNRGKLLTGGRSKDKSSIFGFLRK